MKQARRWIAGAVAASLAAASVGMYVTAQDKKADVKPVQVEATRKQVRMLDDLYKTAVVLITKHYVNDKQTASAGTAAKLLFKEMKAKGWHEVELLDVSGKPYNDENVANDDWEKSALKEIKGGKGYVDAVISKDGKPYLRAATAVPVVMEKCTLCHDNYKEVKAGQAIGALVYTLPIE